MPTEEERRRAIAARANRKAVEEARVAHDARVRESFEDYFRKEKEALRQKQAQQRSAENVRRKQQAEAARLGMQRRAEDKQEQKQTAREAAEWRIIANDVARRVRGVTVARVMEEIVKVRATGRTPNNWTAYMIWWMRDR